MSTRTLLASLLVLALGVAPVSVGSLAHAQDDAPDAEAEPVPNPEAEAAAEADAEAEAEADAAAAEASERETHAREAASSVEAALEQLRTAHIGELASRTRGALQDARPLLRTTGALTTIAREIDGTERTIGRLAHPSRVGRIPRLSQRELADARATWRRHADLLDDWQHSLTERIAELEEARAALVEIRQQWAELRDISEAAGSPEGRHERIVASLTEARSGAQALDDERARIAAIGDQVTDLQIVVADVSDQLRDAASAYHERLTVRDAPPIYAGLTPDGTEEASMVAQARESFLQRAQLPDELLREVLPSLLGLVVFFGLVVALLAALGRKPKRDGPAEAAADAPLAPRDSVLDSGAAGPVQPAPPPPEAAPAPIGPYAREVLARPIAAATLLTLIGASFVIEHAPIVVYDAIFFAMLAPLWRAVPPLCHKPVGLLVKGAIVFVAADRVQAFLPEGTASLRVVLLLEALAAIIALGYWLRSQWGQPVSRAIRTLVSLALLVLLVGFVANLAGYVFFATVLTRGTGFAAYSALTYAGAVIVIEAMADLFVASPVGRRARSLREHPGLVHKQTLRVLVTGATLGFFVASLDGYGLWGSFSSAAEDFLGEAHEVGTLSMSFGAVLGAILVLVLTSLVLRFVRFVLELDLLPRLRLEPGVDGAISGLTRYLIGGMGLLIALASLGIDTAQIALVAGALGVGIGFGLQGIVANFIAGIVLMIERPVRLGDFVEVGTLVGVVERIGLRSSTIRALDGAEVIVPNESLISREVTNWTLSDRMRRVAINVGVAYGSDPHVVLKLLRGVVDAHAGIIQLDKTRIIFDAFGESSLDFRVLFWAGSIDDAMRLKSEVGVAVFDALKNAGIEIPFPQREVRVIAMPDPAEPAPAESLPTESLPAVASPPTTKTPPKD